MHNKGEGIVRFIGEVDFADGTLCGIELDGAQGCQNKMLQKKRYFECKPKHGIFARLSSLKLIESSLLSNQLQQNEFEEIGIKSKDELVVGDKVSIKNKGTGYIRFIGTTHFSKNDSIYGIELNEPLGTNNGSRDNQNYFKCDSLHGIFARIDDIKSKFVPKAVDDAVYKLNDFVNITNMGEGYIRYIGPLHFLSGSVRAFGIELVQKNGKHNGSLKGQKYFKCAPGHGIFCRKHQIKGMATESVRVLKEKLINKYVKVKKRGNGHVRFVGNVDFAMGDAVIIGVEMDEAVGNCNGTKKGEKYFKCKEQHGLFTINENVKVIKKRNMICCRSSARCLHPETMISVFVDSKLSQKMIKDIDIGDSILSYDRSSNQLITSTVDNVFQINLARNQLIKLTLCGDDKASYIQCTADHTFCNQRNS